MKRIMLLLALAVPSLCQAQEINPATETAAADRQADSLLRHNDIIALHRILAHDTLSPAKRLHVEAVTAARLRQFDRSNKAIMEIFEHPELAAEIAPGELSTLAALLGTNARMAADYPAIVEIYRDFAEQYAADDPGREPLLRAIDFYSGLAALPATRMERPDEEVAAQLHIDTVYNGYIIRIDTEVNGRPARMIFDTGCAEMSFVGERFASEYGIRNTGVPLKIRGAGGDGEGWVGIADSVCVGNIKLYNPLFAVTPDTEIALPDSTTIRLDAVLGCNFILPLGIVEFNGENRSIHFPAPASGVIDEEPNMWMDDNGLFYTLALADGHPVVMTVDSGCSKTSFTDAYFSKYRDEIEVAGKKTDIMAGGYGGTIKGEGYQKPAVSLNVDGQSMTLHNVKISHAMKGAHEIGEDGTLGLDFFLSHRRVRIDYTTMRIRLNHDKENDSALKPIVRGQDRESKHCELNASVRQSAGGNKSHRAVKRPVWESKNRRAAISIVTNSPTKH